MRTRFELTGTGAVLLLGSVALLVVGLVFGFTVATGLGAAGLVALLLAVLFIAVPPRLSVTRTVSPDRVTVGEEATGHLEVANRGRLPSLRFDAVEHLDGASLPVHVASVPAYARRALTYRIPAPYRGLVRVGPIELDRRDPLGLLRRSARLTDETWLWVHPRVHPARPLPVGLVPDFEARSSEQEQRGSMAFSSLREYEPGDDPRHIHWRTTARIGTLVVQEQVDTHEPAADIVLDTRRSVLAGDRLEAAIELAASVAVAAHRVGHDIRLHVVGEDLALVADCGGFSLLDRLAAVRPAGEDADQVSLLSLMERSAAGGCLLVLSGSEPGLVERIAAARRRFGRVVLILMEPPGDHEAAVVRRPGFAVLRASTASDAVAAWNQLMG